MKQEQSCCCARAAVSSAQSEQVEAARELTVLDTQRDEQAGARASVHVERAADSRQAG